MNDNAPDNAGVIAPPPLIYALPLIAGILVNRRVPTTFLPPKWARALGAMLVLGGALLQAWFAVTMRRAQTPILPTQPTRTIVTHGPFQFTRNPAYLGFSLTYLGVTCLANSLWSLLFFPLSVAVMRRGVIAREERYLERTFGVEYRRYKMYVRRWL